MIDLIDNSTFEKISNSVDFDKFTYSDLLKNDKFSNSLKKYILLENYQDQFDRYDLLTLYYNKYYWFVYFFKEYLNVFSVDNLNLRQMEFKILEEGETYSNIDWNKIQEISNILEKNDK